MQTEYRNITTKTDHRYFSYLLSSHFFVAGAGDKIGWAFGLGLERYAMKLFEIPDIRLFWSKDERFLSQYRIDQNAIFKPFSKYPPSYKDISFWVEQQEEFSANDLFEIVRTVAGDVIEEVIS